MSRDNMEYGVSLGGYKSIEPIVVPISLLHTGLNVEDGPADIADTEAVDMNKVRIVRGGIAPEYSFVPFPPDDAITAPGPVLHITDFEKKSGVKLVVRMFYNGWQWFDGAKWNTVLGSIAGIANRRMYAVVMDDKLIVANGQTKLQSWDGNPLNQVGDLSGEAPGAFFVTRIGQRLLVANLRFDPASDFDPNQVAWSADGDILEWTDNVLGAGNLVLKPEGGSSSADYITGLSSIERGVLLYRQRSLVLASRTGNRAAPFRFTTIDFSHGTKSPYAIASGGLALGDFFIGHDYVVYHFDGKSPPVGIGLPIQRRLEQRISELEECVAFINPVTMQYHLLSPTSDLAKPALADLHSFSIRDYIRKQKLSWSYRALDELSVTTAAYLPRVAANFVPFVDSLDRTMDRVDPTDSPIHVASVAFQGVAGPPPPPPTARRTMIGSFGIDSNMALVGFNANGSPKSPTPDGHFAESRGDELVRVGGILDAWAAVGARFATRVVGGSNTLLMVNYPTDRRFSVTKWKDLHKRWVDRVNSVANGAARLRAAIRAFTFGWVTGFDDFVEGGTTKNAFLNRLTFEEIEECSAYHKSFFPWCPIVGRGPCTRLRDRARDPGTGTEWSNEGSRVNGVRQYRYLDAGWGQVRPKFLNNDVAGTPKTAVTYMNEQVAAGLECGLAFIAGTNLHMGDGLDPVWGCIDSDPGSGRCGVSPAELLAVGTAAMNKPEVCGFLIYSYLDGTPYWNLQGMQDTMEDIYQLSVPRPEGPISVRGVDYFS